MQERRGKDRKQSKAPTGDLVKVPVQYWQELKERDLERLCEHALARAHPPEGLVLSFLGEGILVDTKAQCLKRPNQGRWEKVGYPLMELIFLVYLLNPAIPLVVAYRRFLYHPLMDHPEMPDAWLAYYLLYTLLLSLVLYILSCRLFKNYAARFADEL